MENQITYLSGSLEYMLRNLSRVDKVELGIHIFLFASSTSPRMTKRLVGDIAQSFDWFIDFNSRSTLYEI